MYAKNSLSLSLEESGISSELLQKSKLLQAMGTRSRDIALGILRERNWRGTFLVFSSSVSMKLKFPQREPDERLSHPRNPFAAT